MSDIHYVVGLEPAVEKLLQRTDAIDKQLTAITSLLENLAMTFEEKTQLLIDYAKALKGQLAAIDNGEAEATIAALRAEVAAAAAALAAAQGKIAADTAQEEALGAQIDELLPAPAVKPEALNPDPIVKPKPVVTTDEMIA